MQHSSDTDTLMKRLRRQAWAVSMLLAAMSGCAVETDATEEGDDERESESEEATELDVSNAALSASNPALFVDNFGYSSGWRVDRHPRLADDVTGDGRRDVVGFGEAGVYVAPSTGNAFGPVTLWLGNFGAAESGGGWEIGKHPRLLADVNGDRRKDVVGFGYAGVWVALSTGTSFTAPALWSNNFGYDAGGWRVDRHPRFMADVTGDGRADVVGFGDAGVYVARSTGSGFTAPALWVGNYGYEAGGWRVDRHPRVLADVTGDGRADVVGFGDAGVYVSRALSNSFAAPTLWVNNFGYEAGGWRLDKHPRLLADVNGDRLADVVGFGYAGVWVSLSTGTGFRQPKLWIENFGYDAGGWRVEKHPRFLADANGDGRADVVGFGDAGVYVARSNGHAFTGPKLVVANYGYEAGGWRTELHPRLLARVDANNTSDIVGFGHAGVYVSKLWP